MRRLALFALPLAIACGDKDEPTETGLVDTGDVVDADGDGVDAMDDCDDNDPNNFPGNTESCDDADNDCDGEVDNGVLLSGYADGDGDGYGDATQAVEGCEYGINGFVDNGDDCDDSTADVNPGAVEVCDGLDNDCDVLVDDDDDSLDLGTTTNWYVDGDEDTYGANGAPVQGCSQPDGYVADNTDCDDEDDAQFPGADEYCNGEDDDCNGTDDDDYAVDASTFYEDGDEDKFGDAGSTTTACELPDGYVEDDTDCDDNDDDVFPGADEYCDGVDSDCNGTDDDDYAVDADTWYVDGDSDGFGDSSATGVANCDQPSGYELDNTDCDDGDEDINPDADEICDGVDNDCDSSTAEDDMAVFTDSSGAVSDVTTSVSGTSSSPASYTLSSEGELAFCDGTFYVNLTLEADVEVTGFNGDATTAILDGGETAPVVTIATDELEVDVSNLTLQNGFGATSTTWGTGAGGGIFCEASTTEITLGVTGVVLSTNDGGEDGGGLFASLCDATLDDVEFSGNSATYGGAISSNAAIISLDGVILDGNDGTYGGATWIYDSSLDVLDSSFTSNTGEDGGALYLEESDATLETTEVSGNTSDSYGAVYCSEGSLDWTGTNSDSSGVNSNTDDSDAAIALEGCEAEFDTVDFGDASNGDDNSPYDVLLYSSGGDEIFYNAVDDESFSCDEDACGTASDTLVSASNNSGSNYLRGLEILATTDGTLNSFAPLTYSSGSCDLGLYVMESSTGGAGSWEVIWASTGNTAATSSGYQDSGTIGLPVTSGTYYALMWDHAGCYNYLDFDSSTTGDTVTDLGTVQASLYNSSNSTYSEGDSVSLSDASYDFEMEISATDF